MIFIPFSSASSAIAPRFIPNEHHRNAQLTQTLNYVHQYVPKGTTYFDKTIRIDKNPIKTALNVCKHLISKRVYAVVVSHDEKDSSGHDLSPAAVSYTSGFYQIPVIGISSRDAAFSDKNIHVSFLRTVPPYYHQADVWLEMLSHFGYTKACSKLDFRPHTAPFPEAFVFSTFYFFDDGMVLCGLTRMTQPTLPTSSLNPKYFVYLSLFPFCHFEATLLPLPAPMIFFLFHFP